MKAAIMWIMVFYTLTCALMVAVKCDNDTQPESTISVFSSTPMGSGDSITIDNSTSDDITFSSSTAISMFIPVGTTPPPSATSTSMPGTSTQTTTSTSMETLLFTTSTTSVTNVSISILQPSPTVTITSTMTTDNDTTPATGTVFTTMASPTMTATLPDITTTSTQEIAVTTTQGTTTTSATTATDGPTSTEDETTTQKKTTEAGLAAGVGVAAVVFFALIVVLCALICVFHMFKNNDKKHRRIVEFALQEVNGDSDKLLTQDVLYGHINSSRMVNLPAEKLLSYVPELHRDNCYNADEEYESIKDRDPEFSKHAASLDCNETKNRYINIMPRDETRVVLSSIPKVHGSDYINANYIDGYNHENEYIASQGPLPNTTADFWRMIWEQNVHIIVMVTNPVENGMVKCHEYWPTRGMSQYGGMMVTLVGEKLFPEFIEKKFTLTVASKNKKMSQVCVVREIIQYHFTDWPDFGVPENASSMLKFVRRVRNTISPTHGPVVIHCSAGVGRTGTFIAIDVMLQKMAAKDNLNIQEFVCRMRAQRAFMIQTSAQYLFVYDALLHAFVYGCTEVKSSQLKEHLEKLDKPVTDNSDVTLVDNEFKHVISMRFPSDHFFSVAMEDYNAAKNRSIENLPLDHNRVILEDVDKAAGEDYINASFIDGYYNRIEFIATQHPLPTTRGDLWRMVLERDINTLVTIGALEDDYDCYWPVEGMHEYEGGVTVQIKETEEIEEAKITKRIFHVSMEQSESFVSVAQFHLHGWPKEGIPPSPKMMIELVERSRQHWRETGFNLIAVHTATDVQGEVSGVYCAACVLMRQLEVEGCVDVVTTAQKLRQKRPAIITNKDYYRFIYDVLASTL